MPTPSRKTPQRIARVLDLHRHGASAREIADDIGVSHFAVNSWLREAGLKPNGGSGGRKGRKREESTGAAEVIAGAEQALAEFAIGSLPKDRVGAVEYLRTRLEQVSKMAQQYGAQTIAGVPAMADFERAIKLEQNLAGQIAALSPPTPPDPENDPTNLEAAAEVREEIEKAVIAMERATVCVHCGKNPYHR